MSSKVKTSVCKRCGDVCIPRPSELCHSCMEMASLIGHQVARARNVYARYLLEKAVKEDEWRYHMTLKDLEPEEINDG